MGRVRVAFAGLLATFAVVPALAAPPALTIEITGPARPLFDVAATPCESFTQPDVNPRAFRTASGATRMFALDQDNRSFLGADLSQAKPTCRSSLPSGENADPAAFDGRRYITATWTFDGRAVAALVHDEYHADAHPGRCRTTDGLSCWYNSVVAARSSDGGATFAPASPLVVAAAPFRQDVDQTRHRGFFNPSNMFAGPGGVYVFTSTTGWSGQDAGACLLRNANPLDSGGWRGWDGRAFAARWRDPYAGPPRADPCRPIAPFGYPVASVVRHRASGAWLAIWEQPKLEGATPFGVFPIAGFYLATSRDLLHWSDPEIFLPTGVVHQPCGLRDENRDRTISVYPALLDEQATGRNYDDIGDTAWLYFTQIALEGCNAGTPPRADAPRRHDPAAGAALTRAMHEQSKRYAFLNRVCSHPAYE